MLRPDELNILDEHIKAAAYYIPRLRFYDEATRDSTSSDAAGVAAPSEEVRICFHW